MENVSLEDKFADCKIKAEQGFASAQFSLGLSYYKGTGVAQDAEQAVEWFRKAAEQGDDVAQYNLGVLYRNTI